MPNCKFCNAEMSEAAANASLFAMSFLTVGGQKLNRNEVAKFANRVGPLCPHCLWGYTDLPAHHDPDTDPQPSGQTELQATGERADGEEHRSDEQIGND
jgi:hypothetical protein